MGVGVSAVLFGAIVSVLVEPAVDAESQERLLEACSSVFADGEQPACIAALDETASTDPQLQDDAGPLYAARIEWEEEAGVHRATLHLPLQDGAEVVRGLSFGEGASTDERWEAVGLVLAAMVNVAEVQKPAPSVPEPTPEPEPEPAPEPEPPQPPPSTEWEPHAAVEVGGLVMGLGAPELLAGGGLLRGPVFGQSPLRLTLAVGVAGAGNPTPQIHFRPSVGVEFVFPVDRLEFALRAEALMVLTRWSATRDGVSDSALEPRFGPSLGGSVGIPVWGETGFYLGGAALALLPPVDLRVAGEQLAEGGVVGWEASVGFRVALQR